MPSPRPASSIIPLSWTHLPGGMTQVPTAQFNQLFNILNTAGYVRGAGLSASAVRQRTVATTPAPTSTTPLVRPTATRTRKRRSRSKTANAALMGQQ